MIFDHKKRKDYSSGSNTDKPLELSGSSQSTPEIDSLLDEIDSILESTQKKRSSNSRSDRCRC